MMTETNNTGTIRTLNLTQMALRVALKIIDAMDADYTESDIDSIMEEAESDMDTLRLLRAELGEV